LGPWDCVQAIAFEWIAFDLCADFDVCALRPRYERANDGKEFLWRNYQRTLKPL
jgi:hypothetical protein